MKKRDRYLTGILLILIGIFIGSLVAFYQQNNTVNDHAEVNLTEVTRSSTPIFSDEDLEKIDDRFLFKKIAERVRPTVVYIETTVPVNRSNRAVPDDEFHEDQEPGFWDRFIPRRARTVGSGVLISADGYILTNNHVIQGAVEEGIQVVLNDKRTFNGRVVGNDPTTDLAVIKIDARQLPNITLGDSDQLDVGEWVLAIGNPFRLQSTVTAGIVSALSRDVQIINDQMRVESFIQTDAAINKGNSGGALVNTSGELIGINTAIASQSGSYQGYGFAVPSNLAGKVARDLIEYGEVHRALLGVSIVSMNASQADKLGMETISGVRINTTEEGLAADKHGLRPDDVILSVNGSQVNESNQLQEKIAVLRPGEIVKLKIWRDGEVFDRHVKLSRMQREPNELASNNRSYEYEEDTGDEELPGNREMGIQFTDFDHGFKVMALSKRDNPGSYDLIITEIEEDSKAERQGLKEGFVIVGVEGQKVEDLETLVDLVDQHFQPGSSISVEIKTPGNDVKNIELKK